METPILLENKKPGRAHQEESCVSETTPSKVGARQSVIALSTGEAELYALNKACAGGLGAKSLLSDLGLDLDIQVYTNATTGEALASRRGFSKLRHIAVNEL